MAIEGIALDALTDLAPDPLSDSRLMRQLIEGSEDALAGLYDRHAQAVFATALRVSRDRGIAAEVVQDTFLTLWNRAESFDPARGPLPAWLLAIARHRAIDRLRATARHDRAASFSSFVHGIADDQSTAEWLTSTGGLIGAAGSEPGPEMALSNKETRASIQGAIATLSPLERQVIELAYGTGLSQSEVAAQLGWPIGTVKTRTRRALRHLRERLEGPAVGTGGSDRRAEPQAVFAARPAPTASPCISPC